MNNRIIELHDSDIAGIEWDAGVAVIHLSAAYLHESEGIPGVDTGTVWAQEAELRIENASQPPLPPSKPYRIDDGTLRLDGLEYRNEIPIPLAYNGPVAIALLIADADYQYSEIEITGSGIELRLIGEAKHKERFPGAGTVKFDNLA